MMPIPILLHAGLSFVTGEFLVSGKLLTFLSYLALLGVAFAAATVATALDPGPTTSAIAPASATPAMSPVVVHDVAVVPEQGAPAPTHPDGRRTRRRMAGSNGRA